MYLVYHSKVQCTVCRLPQRLVDNHSFAYRAIHNVLLQSLVWVTLECFGGKACSGLPLHVTCHYKRQCMGLLTVYTDYLLHNRSKVTLSAVYYIQ